MKKLLCIGLFTAALFAPTSAQAGEYGNCKVNGGIKIYINIQTPPATLPLAPWYLYFPAEAQNQPVGPAGGGPPDPRGRRRRHHRRHPDRRRRRPPGRGGAIGRGGDSGPDATPGRRRRPAGRAVAFPTGR